MTLERRVRVGRIFMCAWVLFLAPSFVQVLQSGLGPAQVAAAAGFLVWFAVWIWFWLRALGSGAMASLVGFTAITLIVTCFALIAPTPVAAGGVVVFAFIIGGVAFPPRQAVLALFGLTILQVILMTLRQEDPGEQLSSLLNSVLVGGLGIGVRLLWLSYNELLAAREEIARLAVSEERLRFARDIHDILGQSLATIVLKSELASRDLPADTNDSVRQELHDVVAVARKSLNEVREAVSGYRRTTLPGEISSARAALRAAGIAFVVSDQIGSVPPEQDAVLAWCLREAVTNVVKHSGAGRCDLRLARENGQVTMSVSDDGRGASELTGGSGIAGMRERVALAGGTIDVQTEDGVRLLVKVPAP